MGIKQDVMETLRVEITEEKTDELINYLFDKVPVPWYLKPTVPIAKKFVDKMLPERLLDAIEKLLTKGEENVEG